LPTTISPPDESDGALESPLRAEVDLGEDIKGELGHELGEEKTPASETERRA
jgi:hypothetical protein